MQILVYLTLLNVSFRTFFAWTNDIDAHASLPLQLLLVASTTATIGIGVFVCIALIDWNNVAHLMSVVVVPLIKIDWPGTNYFASFCISCLVVIILTNLYKIVLISFHVWSSILIIAILLEHLQINGIILFNIFNTALCESQNLCLS